MAADLHCHTRSSDGSVGAAEVVRLAKLRGLTAVAVTDHDTFAGSLKAKACGERFGIEVLSGAEFSSTDSATGRKAHVLCYRCENPEKLYDLCRKTGESRRRAGMAMMEKVMALYPIPAEMVMRRSHESTCLYKQHIMHALIDAGYCKDIFGSLFKKLFNSRTGLAYVPIVYPEVHDVIEQIHRAGGIAVLAHPGEYDSYALLESLAEKREIDGVEVWHPRNRDGDEKKFLALARANRLLATGGSDFHGMYTAEPMPVGTCTVPDDQLKRLVRFKK